MRVALFVPCYINDFYPEIALNTMKILRAVGMEVEYPKGQSCCGQPFLNNGLVEEGRRFATRFVDIFAGYDYVVSPGSSCVSTVRHRYPTLLKETHPSGVEEGRVMELCEFLHDVVGVENLHFRHSFPHRVGLHNSCHGLRELRLGRASELILPHYSKIRAVLERVEGIELVDPERDECCGFGGTFSTGEEAVSVMMGRDRIDDHESHGVDFVTGVDISCLMHMDGLARREGREIGFIHVSEILRGDEV
jgi:L-lactate dehydrogenase complex protein LldE